MNRKHKDDAEDEYSNDFEDSRACSTPGKRVPPLKSAASASGTAASASMGMGMTGAASRMPPSALKVAASEDFTHQHQHQHRAAHHGGHVNVRAASTHSSEQEKQRRNDDEDDNDDHRDDDGNDYESAALQDLYGAALLSSQVRGACCARSC